MTLAGLLPPLDGRVRLDNNDVSDFDESDLRRAIGFFAEDAHIFTTTVRDNLLVARGDCADEELTAALEAVGLQSWIAGLPDGLATVLTGGAQALSAGQRRRLMLARAVISPAGIVLLDEPTEHLDVTDSERILRDLLTPNSRLFSPQRTVVVATHHLPTGLGCQQLTVTETQTHSEVSPARHELQRQQHEQ
jgi:ATP-binding cassette subfamily C protein CydC